MENNIKVVGDGTINSGEYDNIKIVGNGTVLGNIKGKEVKVTGSSDFNGEGEFEKLKVNGNVVFNYNVKCNNVTINGEGIVRGNLYGKEVKINGRIIVEGDIECEDIIIRGEIKCKGLLNSERIRIYLRGESECNEIGTSNIEVLKKDSINLINIFDKFGYKKFICNSLEGDFIKLENSNIINVRGKDIFIKEDCNIDNLEYTGNLNVDKRSNIKNKVKIS